MTRVCLGDVANERKENCKTNEYNDHIVGLEHLIPQEVTLTQWAENIENTFTKVFHKGDVLFGRRRAYLKKAAVAPFDGICSGDITVIEAKPNKIVPELLPFIIQNDNLFDYAVEKSAGSLSPRVKWSHLQNYEFELPDLNKQRELAELLWAAEETRQAYKKLLHQNDNIVKARFLELFSNSKICSLSDIANITAGQSSPHDEEFSKEGIPFIKAGNLENLKFNNMTEQDCNLVNDDLAKIKKLKLHKKGTVLVAKSGMSCLSGNIYILKNSAYVVSHLACIECKENLSSPEFIKTFFDITGVKELIKDPSYPSIQLSQLSEMKLPYIHFIQQQKFALYVKQVEKSKYILNKSLEQLNLMISQLINQNLTKEVSHV